jgi:hypothetical protein
VCIEKKFGLPIVGFIISILSLLCRSPLLLMAGESKLRHRQLIGMDNVNAFLS